MAKRNLFADQKSNTEKIGWLKENDSLQHTQISSLLRKYELVGKVVNQAQQVVNSFDEEFGQEFASVFGDIRNHIKQYEDITDSIFESDWDQELAEGRHDKVREQVGKWKNELDTLFSNITTIYRNHPFLTILHNQAVPGISDISGLRSTLESNVKYAEKAVGALKTKLQDEQLKVYTGEFETFANRFRDTAHLWLVAIAVLAGALLLVAGAFFFGLDGQITVCGHIIPLPHPTNTAISIAYVVSQLAILSLISWAILFCSKNYSTNRNMEFIFRQKHLITSNFLLFINGIKDFALRDQATLEMVQTIFAVEKSGYIKDNGGTNDSAPTLPVQLSGKLPTS